MSGGPRIRPEEVAKVKEFSERFPTMTTADLASISGRSDSTVRAILRGDYDGEKPETKEPDLFDYQSAEAMGTLADKLDKTNALLARIAAALDKE